MGIDGVAIALYTGWWWFAAGSGAVMLGIVLWSAPTAARIERAQTRWRAGYEGAVLDELLMTPVNA